MKLTTAIIALLLASAFVHAEEKIVWNGDGIGKNGMWKKNAAAEIEKGVAKIHLTGTKWSGVGLNWCGYWPADAGTKLADYAFVSIKMKVEGNARAVSVTLLDNKKTKSATVSLNGYAPESISKDVVCVKIPTEKFLKDAKFKSGKVWEIMLSAWTQNEKNIKVTIDEIAFTKE